MGGRSAVSPTHQALPLEHLKIAADSGLGAGELLGKRDDVEGSPLQHLSVWRWTPGGGCQSGLHFRRVLFRSTRRCLSSTSRARRIVGWEQANCSASVTTSRVPFSTTAETIWFNRCLRCMWPTLSQMLTMIARYLLGRAPYCALSRLQRTNSRYHRMIH